MSEIEEKSEARNITKKQKNKAYQPHRIKLP